MAHDVRHHRQSCPHGPHLPICLTWIHTRLGIMQLQHGDPERFYTSAGNPVKEILLKLNLPDHRILKDGGEVLKITSPLTSKDKGTSSSLKSKNTTTYSQEKVKFTR
ncbi:hypothetical protein Tco_1554681 [Tanacetum coccineum]